MRERILVVEDEPDILDLVCYNLQQAGLEVERAGDGETALKVVAERPPDLIVLDLMLPGIDGLEVCRRLKQSEEHRRIPVLMLTARAAEVDRIVGLELGADDYLTKPFSPRELVLRVRAVLRRAAKAEGDDPEEPGERLEFGPLTIDPDGHRVLVEGREIDLTATEFRLVHTLAQRRGRVQTREELLTVVWGYTYAGYSRTVDTHVRRLREKLGPAGALIETVRGVGYRFRREPD
ncbi:MAG: response regulator [Candidatus Latescibacterota bacterium]|jgi:two-component system phosphate regulon response regulator PhoB